MMESGLDLLLYLNTSCLECADLREPPNGILYIPPPPLPAFLQLALNTSAEPCNKQCEWNMVPGIEYVERARQGPVLDDTWLLVLISSCVGVLVLGALFALVLIKCRVDRNNKSTLQLDAASLDKTKGSKGCEAVLYPLPTDSRVLWAALTPRGTTQHFTTEPPVRHHVPPTCPLPPIPPPQPLTSFENSGFIDSDDPTPLLESYQLNDLLEAVYPSSLKRMHGGSPQLSSIRPFVSSPTRIEHPNLPPLNLHPHHRTLRRASVTRRDSDVSVPSAVIL